MKIVTCANCQTNYTDLQNKCPICGQLTAEKGIKNKRNIYKVDSLRVFKSEDGMMGLQDEFERTIVPAIFQEIGFFQLLFDQESYCRIKFNNAYGFIDPFGEYKVYPIFQYLHQFDAAGYCLAVKNNRYGYINREGFWIIPPMCDLWFDYRFDDYKYIPVFDLNNYSKACLNGKFGFIDRKGIWVIPPIYNAIGDEFNSENYCIAELNSKIGYIDRFNNWVVAPRYMNVELSKDKSDADESTKTEL